MVTPDGGLPRSNDRAAEEEEIGARLDIATGLLDFTLGYVHGELARRYPDHEFLVTLSVKPDYPWLIATGTPVPPYEKDSAPEHIEFAVWKVTGAIHEVRGGEVQDPPLFLGIFSA